VNDRSAIPVLKQSIYAHTGGNHQATVAVTRGLRTGGAGARLFAQGARL
jgi:hypothetical protein